MASFELLQAGVIGLYLLGMALFFTGSATGKDRLKRLANGLAVAGFAFHTLDLVLAVSLFPEEALQGGSFHFSFLAWSLLAVYFLLWWRFKHTFFALTASPLALILFIVSLASGSIRLKMPKELAGLFFGLHIGSLFLSMALLAAAFGAAVAFLYLERKIKTKSRLAGLGKDMPSLSTFDKVNHWAIAAGFPLYTLGLVSGFVWGRMTWGRIFTWDPKEVAAMAVWFLFAFLFHQRLAMGWRGRKPAVLVLWVFAFTLVSLLGVNFLLQSHHSFLPPQQ